MLSRFNASLPLNSDKFKNIYKEVRDFKTNFKERFELNHNMDGTLDTADGNCDGYHKKLDMPACDYEGEILAGDIVEISDDTSYGVLHCREIDDVIELCFQNSSGVYQMTDKGYIATDLDNWDTKTFDASVTIRQIIYNSTVGLYIAVGYTSSYGKIYTSSDLITWTEKFSLSSIGFFRISYNDSIYVVTGLSQSGVPTAYIYSSSDLNTWTQRQISASIIPFGLCYGNGLFVAVGSWQYSGAYYKRLFKSSNGTSWTSPGVASDGIILYDVCYGDGLYVTVGNYIHTSLDAETLTYRLTPTEILRAINYYNGLYVAVGNSGYIYTSPDGINWTQRATLGYALYSVYYSPYRGGIWIAAGASGKIYTSPDGITWTERTSGVSTDLYGIISRDNIKLSGETYKNTFLISGASGVVRTSKKYIEVS